MGKTGEFARYAGLLPMATERGRDSQVRMFCDAAARWASRRHALAYRRAGSSAYAPGLTFRRVYRRFLLFSRWAPRHVGGIAYEPYRVARR